ncbi:MAG: alkane 1-monooxygenase [Actinomycetia bacterium]|nr:alkane 1-monooxygenase [Actinomycetes bacterium]
MSVPLSILDLASIGKGETAKDSLLGSVALAREAERSGYKRVWYAEHHNMPAIASSATSVLIAHVAANTDTIRLGAGGIMLPNHSPLVIAEQFGTLETLHPGRIDLGLGRAPGSDQATMYAMRRDPMSAQTFPQDVQELQGYLSGRTLVPGVHATPGNGTNVPLYILGSSLFGATLAAALGLPYAFASHFAPGALQDAVAVYRKEFQPSEQLDRSYVIAGVNVLAAETEEEARAGLQAVRRSRVAFFLGRDRDLSDAEADALIASPQGQQLAEMMRYSIAGTPGQVTEYLDTFADHADADELMVAHQAPSVEGRVRSTRLVAEARGLVSTEAGR